MKRSGISKPARSTGVESPRTKTGRAPEERNDRLQATKTMMDFPKTGKLLKAERKQAESASKKAHGQLELRVKERTAQLSEANAVLEEQIRERQQFEAALRESEERFRSAFDHAAIGMALVTPQFRFQRVNRSLCEMLGYSQQELLTKTFQDVTHPEDREVGEKLVRSVLAGEQDSFRLEKRYLHKQGQVIWALQAASLVRDSDGKPLYFIAQHKDITERRLAEEELRTSHEELRRLSAHLESAREEERKQIAREIHDELGQAMTALKLDLAWLIEELGPHQKTQSSHAEDMLTRVDATIQSLRRILTSLRPAVLDDLGLGAAIEWQAQKFQERTRIQCKLALGIDNLVREPARCTAVFRIFQEALTNVARHAEATMVEVRLKETTGDLVLTVRDNGKGIGEEQATGSETFGILGMRERAFLLGGQVEIRGTQGKGTEVTVRVPLHREKAGGRR